MDIYFEIYRNPNNMLYYWRLRKISSPVGYLLGDADFVTDEIIATGHQGYRDIEKAKDDIKKVISAIPSTKIKII
jgi:hypothetical protein